MKHRKQTELTNDDIDRLATEVARRERYKEQKRSLNTAIRRAAGQPGPTREVRSREVSPPLPPRDAQERRDDAVSESR